MNNMRRTVSGFAIASILALGASCSTDGTNPYIVPDYQNSPRALTPYGPEGAPSDANTGSTTPSSPSTPTAGGPMSLDELYSIAQEIRAANPGKSNEEISALIAERIKQRKK